MNWPFRRPTLVSLAKERASTRNKSSKPDHYYEKYERYFSQLRDRPGAIVFEIGVYEGESTKVLSRYLPDALIVGVDLKLRQIDLQGYPNVRLYQGDQTDAAFLQRLAAEHAPNGIDLVIDDASHVGELSHRTFGILFPLLKPGGLYAVEDWGTGYWPKWPSGHDFQSVEVEGSRIKSHDFGMVGFLKSLVDHIAPAETHLPSAAELHILPGTAILQKAQGQLSPTGKPKSSGRMDMASKSLNSGMAITFVGRALRAIKRRLFPAPLVFDLGMHSGADTRAYLLQGFRVVAVEADPALWAKARKRFAKSIASGRLHVENVGLNTTHGTAKFYLNDFSQWSSFIEHLGVRGGKYRVVEIPCIPVTDLFDKYGMPHYLKIDIEGLDIEVVRQLTKYSKRPRYISVEDGGIATLEALLASGVKGVKFSDQVAIQKISGPETSGPFGEQLPGKWLSPGEATKYYAENIRTADGTPRHPVWWDIHGYY